MPREDIEMSEQQFIPIPASISEYEGKLAVLGVFPNVPQSRMMEVISKIDPQMLDKSPLQIAMFSGDVENGILSVLGLWENKDWLNFFMNSLKTVLDSYTMEPDEENVETSIVHVATINPAYDLRTLPATAVMVETEYLHATTQEYDAVVQALPGGSPGNMLHLACIGTTKYDTLRIYEVYSDIASAQTFGAVLGPIIKKTIGRESSALKRVSPVMAITRHEMASSRK